MKVAEAKALDTVHAKLTRCAVLAPVAIGVNLIELTLIGCFLAGLAYLVNYNHAETQHYKVFISLAGNVLMCFVLAFPGYFVVTGLSKLYAKKSKSAAYIFAISGVIIWLGVDLALSFVNLSELSLPLAAAVYGIAGNALAQLIAAVVVVCRCKE